MGIYESIQRNQGNIDSIAGLVGDITGRSMRARQRAELQKLLSTEGALDPATKHAVNYINTMELPFDRSAPRAGNPTHAGVMEEPQAAAAPPAAQPATRPRSATAADAGAIGSILDYGPEELMKLAAGLEDRDRSRESIDRRARREGLITLPNGATLYDLDRGEPRYTDPDNYGDQELTPYQRESLRLREAELLNRGSGKSGPGAAPKMSAALKTAETRKNSLQSQIRRLYPKMNLDEIIMAGQAPEEWDPETRKGIEAGVYNEKDAATIGTRAPIKVIQDYLNAISDYESRAAVEGVEFTPAYDNAVAQASQRQTLAPGEAKQGAADVPGKILIRLKAAYDKYPAGKKFRIDPDTFDPSIHELVK